jgi:hypothetical protein
VVKIWEKIEDFLNGFLTKLIDSFILLIKKLTPKKIKDALNKTEKLIKDFKGNTKAKALGFVTKSKDNIKNAGPILQEKQKAVIMGIHKAQDAAKNFKPKEVKFNNLCGSLCDKIKPRVQKILDKFPDIPAKLFWPGFILLTLASVAAYISYKSASDVVIKTAKDVYGIEKKKEVKKVIEKIVRPSYYKIDEKKLRVRNVTIPVYVESITAMKSLVFDITIESTNKYIREYFFENIYLMHDRLNSSLEPVIPTFPMEKEGLEIIRTKVQHELNSLIENLKIKGHVEKVYIHSVIAG